MHVYVVPVVGKGNCDENSKIFIIFYIFLIDINIEDDIGHNLLEFFHKFTECAL